eukprot:542413-Rhodomonas_salina.1
MIGPSESGLGGGGWARTHAEAAVLGHGRCRLLWQLKLLTPQLRSILNPILLTLNSKPATLNPILRGLTLNSQPLNQEVTAVNRCALASLRHPAPPGSTQP